MKATTLPAVVTAALFALLIDVRPGLCVTTPAREAAGKDQPCSQACLAKVAADYDEARCNRFHSGNQVTNVSRNAVEGQGARTCVTANEGNKPWGPALEQRFPVIDVEHGTVLGITLLMYANQVMYVSEVFKVEQDRITHIDNIGLVKPGLEHTTGFGTHK
jgi:hypothetical protein